MASSDHQKKGFLARLVERESRPGRLARSLALGVYVTLCPFVGLQTWIAFPLAVVFRANVVISLIFLYAVSNIWTFIPIVVGVYVASDWLMQLLLGHDLAQYNPTWAGWIDNKIGPYLYSYLGIDSISVWGFIIGGNIIAISCALALYPLIRLGARSLVRRYGGGSAA